MKKSIFTPDRVATEEFQYSERTVIENYARRIRVDEASEKAIQKGDAFAREIEERFFADFEKTPEMVAAGRADKIDHMAHVGTFAVIDGYVYTTYYANSTYHAEDPDNQTARLAYCPVNNPAEMTYVDVQSVGDELDGRKIQKVYDTIFMQRDEDTIFVMWTAQADNNYYRFYCPFTLSTKTLGEIGVHRFRVGDIVNDFSVSGMKNALCANRTLIKDMYSDIGIMQKQTWRDEEDGRYCYSGAYHGDFTCIIKSRDLVEWELVEVPDFKNDSQWENATYVYDNKVFYFVRQHTGSSGGFLTCFDLKTRRWAKPVIIDDCQSRSDFIMYKGGLYLFHAPIDREHIGIVKIDTDDIAKSEIVLQAKMHTSCFYPYVNYFEGEELAMIYTVERKHMRLARFDLGKYLD